MKIIARPIDVVAFFPKNKPPVPRKFRYEEGDGQAVAVSIDRVVSVEQKKTAGVLCYVYCCQSLMDGQDKRYELKYTLSDCRWELYKI